LEVKTVFDSQIDVTKANSHIKEIDIIKAIGIILMVLGHCGFIFKHFIYVFHMSLFFVVSGYCYNNKNSKDFTNLLQYVLKKVKTLYIPYILVGILFLLLNNIFLQYDLITDNILFSVNAINEYSGLAGKFSFQIFIVELLKLLCFYGGSVPFYGATWFLRVLFLTSIIYVILDYLTQRFLKIEKYQYILRIVVSLGLMLFSYYCNKIQFKWEILGIEIIDKIKYACTACVLLEVGRILRIYMARLINIQRYGIGIFSGIVLIILNQFGTMELAQNEIVNPVFFLSASITGFIFCYFLAEMIIAVKIDKCFCYIGKHTLSILLFHFLAFKLITVAQVSIYGLPVYMRASFPTLYTQWYWVIAYSVIGIGIPLLLEYFYCIIKRRICTLFI